MIFPLAAWGQLQFQAPQNLQQGYVMRVEATGADAGKKLTAEFLGKKVPFYSDGNGGLYALVPAAVMTSPGSVPLTVRDAAGTSVFTSSIEILDGHYLEQNIVTSSRMRSLRTSDEEMKRMAAFRAAIGPKKMWTEPLLRPTPECSNSPFGVKRRNDGKLTGAIHAGLDFRSPKGRAVKASDAGVVKVARMFPRQGGTVGLDHGQGLQTTYIHLSKIAAVEGKTVKRGQVIGYVGSTGFATGPHLHWSVHVHGVPVNPNQWVPGIESCKPLE